MYCYYNWNNERQLIISPDLIATKKRKTNDSAKNCSTHAW